MGGKAEVLLSGTKENEEESEGEWVKSVRDLSPFGCDLFDLPLWV